MLSSMASGGVAATSIFGSRTPKRVLRCRSVVGLDRPSHMVISELESAIVTTHSSVVTKCQGNELQQVSRSPDQAQAIHDQSGSTRTDKRGLRGSTFAQRPLMQLMPGEGETQTAIQGGVGRFSFDSEGSHDGVDRQPGNHRAEEDGSNITLARRGTQATNHTSAFSWTEDEIVYE